MAWHEQGSRKICLNPTQGEQVATQRVGHGIGFVISLLVNRMDGRIQLISEQEVGTVLIPSRAIEFGRYFRVVRGLDR